jgi:hypothetical protein
MSVEITRAGLRAKIHNGRPCSCCGRNVYPPFMVWEGATDILICGQCAERVKDGFVADLIHLRAVREIQKFQPNFGITLARARVHDLEKQEEAAEREFRAKHFSH